MRDLQKTFYLRLVAVLILLSIIQMPDSIYAQSVKDWSIVNQTLSVGQGVIRYEYNVDQSLELSLVDVAKEKWYRCAYVFVEGDGTFGINQAGISLSEEFPGSIVFEGGYDTKIHIQKGGKVLQSKVIISIELIEPEVENLNKLAVLTVDPSVPTDQLVNDVFIGGNCYNTNNISYLGHTESSGTFNNGLNTLGVMDGVMLSSGNLTNAPGPNTITNAGNALNTAGDPDLEIIANTPFVYDASILEFDFEPTTDTIRFKYIFASEEYCDYSNSNYNDAFGFFLSGPGINGPYSNNAINIAALPSGQAVSINNVNHINNPAYYISNTIPATNTGFRCNGNPLGTQPGISELEFDGFTVLLEAVAVVQPCQTYHIKLAIGDVYDRYFDSAVFLASNSFTSGDLVLAEFNNPTTNLANGTEGCDDAYLEICRLDTVDTSNPLDVSYSIDPISTATPGIDFTALPTTITIPAGQNCIQIPMELIADDITEGSEILRLIIDQSCSCSSNFVDFEINDQVPVELALTSDQTVCPGESVTLEATGINGTGSLTYLWNTGETSSSIQVSPSTSDLYSVTVTDACNQENNDSVQVLVATPPTAFIDGDGVLCTGQGGSVPVNIDLTGSGPWEVSYTLDGVEQTLITTSDNPHVLNVSEVGTYNLLSVIDLDNTCVGSVSGSSIVTETAVDFNLETTDLSCFDNQSGEIDVLVNTGTSPYQYDWSVAGVLGNNPTELDAGGYTVTVTDANGCIANTSTVLDQPDSILIDISDIVDINCIEPIASAIASASGGAGQTYTFDWSNGDIGNQFNSVVPGDFEVSVTDENNCLQTAELSISIDTAGIATVNGDDHTLTCAIDSLNITGIQTDVPVNTLDFSWTTADGQIVSGATSLTPLVDAPGTYTVQITNNSNGCIENEEVLVGEDVAVPQVDAGLGDTLTCIILDLTLDGSGSDSGTGFDLNWTTPNGNIVSGSSTTTPLIDAPGIYQLEVIDISNGCSSNASVEVQENSDAPTVGISSSIDELTCIETIATLIGSVSGTGPDYTYNWSGTGGVLILSGQGTISALVGSSGVYSLEVTDNGNGCSSLEDIEIFEDVTPPTVEAVSDDILDCVTAAVDLSSTVSGSGTTFSYQWYDTNNQAISGATNATTTVQSVGTYTLEVVDNDNGCVNSNTVEVIEDVVLPEVSLAVSETLSCALTEVDITTSVSQVDTATYNWVDASGQPIVGASSSELSVTTPGTYQVTVENIENGCITTDEITVEQDISLPDVLVADVDELTCADTTVEIDATASSSGPNYTYNWTTANGNIVSGANQLNPTVDVSGDYTLEILNNDNGCVSSAGVEVVEDINEPVVSITSSSDEITCLETNITLNGSVAGGGANYAYNWIDSTGVLILTGQGTPTAQIGSSGIFILEVLDNDNGCSSLEDIEIFEDVTPPTVEAVSDDILDCVTAAVDLSSTVSGSGTTFSYQWYDTNNQAISGATNATTTVQSVGTYTLEVVDNDNGCVNSNTVEVIEDVVLPEVSLAVSETLSCALTEVDITTSVSQVDTATYNWVDASGQPIVGASSSELSVTTPGTYQVTVENIENGCITTDEITVEQDISLPDVLVADVDELTCADTTVEIDATASSSGPNYTYNWTTANGNIVSGANQLNPTVDVSGDYNLEITNSDNGCVVSSIVFVDENVAFPTVQIQSDGMLTCEDGLVSLDGANSSNGPIYEFSWTTVDGNLVGATNQIQAEADQSGTYELMVLNIDNGCLSTTEVFVESNTDAPTAVIDNAALLTCTQVSIELNGALSSGSSLDFRWIDLANGTEIGQAETVLVTEPGVYELEVTDGENGCIGVEEVLIEQNIFEPTASIDSIAMLTCTVNEVQVVATSETNSNQAEYTWSTNNGNITGNLDGISTTVSMIGNYQLTVIDPVNGCSTVVSAVVAEDVNYPDIDILPTSAITCVDSTANLQVEVINGNPSFEFEWEAISGNITGAVNLPTVLATMAGEYAVEVTDPSNGCVSQTNILVEEDFEAPLSVASSDDVLTCDLEQVWIHGIGSDQGANFTYLWYDENNDPISGANSIILAVSEPGFYTFEVLDGLNGCASSALVEVIQNIESPDFSLSVPAELTCFETEVSILSTVYSNTPVSYNWMTAGSNQTIGVGADLIVVEPGMYVLELEDEMTGCVAVQDIEVLQDVDFPVVELSADGMLTCLDTVLDINAAILGSDEFLELTWINPLGEVLPDPQVQMAVDYAGVYQLSVLNPINGCQTDVSIEVEANSVYPEVIASSPELLDCDTDAVQILLELGLNEGEYEAEWIDPLGQIFQPTQPLSPLVDQAGTYAVIVTDLLNNCSTETSVLIETDYSQPLIDAGLDVVIPCYEESTSLSGTVLDASLDVAVQWFTTSGLILEGGSTTTPEIAQEGVYSFSVVDLGNGCSSLDSVLVEKEQPFDIAVEGLDPVCYGDYGGLNIEVIDQSGPFLYSIDGGEQFTTTSQFAYLASGDYEVVVYDIDGCPSLTEFIEIVEPTEVEVYTEGQVYLEQGTTYYVNSYTNYPVDQIESITWSPAEGLSCTDCLNPTFDGMQSMSYQVEIITSSGCEARATIDFIVDETVDIYVPNVFTPNGDGNNSVAIVFANPTAVKEIDKFCIYDRWGELVFSNEKFPPNNPAHGWDGSFNGKPLDSGVFAYYLEVILADGRKELIKGDITILGQ